MLDIKRIKENPEYAKERLATRQKDYSAEIDRLMELDVERRALIADTEAKKAEQNKISKQIPLFKKEGKDVAPIFAEMKVLSDTVKAETEKIDAIEPFYPDRMASRILGMGDVLSLIEKAEQAYDEKQAAALEKKMREATFTLDDYLDQFAQLKKMGNIESLLGMMPGVNAGALKDAKIDEKQMARTEAIIKSMTKKEREKPDIIGASRKQRIARGSGTTVEDVNKLLKQFEQVRKMRKQFANGGLKRGFFGKGKMKFPM
jgi:hypothetical protein